MQNLEAISDFGKNFRKVGLEVKNSSGQPFYPKSVRSEIEALRHQLFGLEEIAQGNREITRPLRVILNQLDAAIEKVSELEQDAYKLHATSEVLNRLIKVFGKFQGSRDEGKFLKEILTLAADLVCADTGFILGIHPDGELYEIESFGKGDLDYSRSMAKQVLEKGEPILIKNLEKLEFSASVGKLGIVATATFPIHREGRLVGILYLDSRHPGSEFGPETQTNLEVLLNIAEYILGLCHRIAMLRESPLRGVISFGSAIGISQAFADIVKKAEKYAKSEQPILVTGETGTGKELFAQAIHHASPRASGPFNAVNLCESNPNLVLSDLFGHRKGAFTGAEIERQGLIAASEEGTLFLDEIGDLPREVQVVLLRFLDNQQYRRVGEDITRTGNVRIIAATNRNIEDEIKTGRFREDLYHRLLVCKLEITPLRKRREDIGFLWNHYLDLANSRYDSQVITSPEAAILLSCYDWPGNIRELRHMVDRLVLEKAPDGVITPSELGVNQVSASKANTTVSLAEIQKHHVIEVLEQVGRNQTKAAALLGITPRTLYNWLKEWEKEE